MIKLKEFVLTEMPRIASLALKVGKTEALVGGVDTEGVPDKDLKQFVRDLVEHIEKFIKARHAGDYVKHIDITLDKK